MVFEREFEKSFDNPQRYALAAKGLEDYIGVIANFGIEPLQCPDGEVLYTLSTSDFVVSGSSSSVDIEVIANNGKRVFYGKVSGESKPHVDSVVNKLLLSLVLGKSGVSKR